MEWAKPRYTKKQINDAGDYLVRNDDYYENKNQDAIDVVDNFRAVHAFPLNTLQIRLRHHANAVDENNIVAQRLKRLSSILAKLDRFEGMKLWEMQDIGGCRTIVKNLENVEQVITAFKSSSIRHKLTHEDNYIKTPRDSGYRSRHLIYRYISDRSEIYNGLKIEIQIRTPLQHAWATAVETVDAFTQQALKSSRGRSDWERFFQLMGTWMAYRENTAPVPNTPTDTDALQKELKACAIELQVAKTLRGFSTALTVTQGKPVKGADYYLLSLDNVREKLRIARYKRGQLKQATEAYAKSERQIRGKEITDAVLVSVNSISNLKRAYPNYFADTTMFLEELDVALK